MTEGASTELGDWGEASRQVTRGLKRLVTQGLGIEETGDSGADNEEPDKRNRVDESD